MVVTCNALESAVIMKMIVTVRTRMLFEVVVWMVTWQMAVEKVCGTAAAMMEGSFEVGMVVVPMEAFLVMRRIAMVDYEVVSLVAL